MEEKEIQYKEKRNINQGIFAFAEVFLFMIILQAALLVTKSYFCPIVDDNRFLMKMVTMGFMMVFTIVILIYAKVRKITLAVFPEKFTKRYVIVSIIATLLFITTPSNFLQGGGAILVLAYGSIVTPVYEELIFRGYIWNRLSPFVKKQQYMWILVAFLFSAWHLGYVIPNLLHGDWFAVISKLLIGLGYGLILGFVRKNTGNCYSTMLLHGVMNIFM